MSQKPPGRSSYRLLSPLLAIKAPLDIKLYAALNVVGAPLIGLIVVDNLTATVEPLSILFVLFVLALVGVNFLLVWGLLTLQWWGWAGSVGLHSLGALLAFLAIDLQGALVGGIVALYLLVRGNLYVSGSVLPW